MPRVAHNLIAALLTFAIGVVVATLGHRLSDPPKEHGYNEWQKVSNGLGWDLTYMPLLQNSGVCPGELYCEYAAEKKQPPVNKHFSEWQGEPIVSSMLIELPDGHASIDALWLIRTKDKAYWWYFHPDRKDRVGKQSLPTEEYDRAFETMKCWQQHNPSSKTFLDSSGYVGFLSLYEEGKSRQMLLAASDFMDPWSKELSEIQDEARWGRLWKTLKPIYSMISQQKPISAE